MNTNAYSYLPYQSGGSGGRYGVASFGLLLGSPTSPYAGAAMMIRNPSDGSQASAGSDYMVSSAPSSLGENAPKPPSSPASPASPVEGISNDLSYFDFHGSSKGQLLHHQKQEDLSMDHTDTIKKEECPDDYPPPVAPLQGISGSSWDWYQYYDFIAKVEHGQMPHWRLKKGLTPTADCPEVRPIPGVDHAT